MTTLPWFQNAPERPLCDESDPAEKGAPRAPADAIELDIRADSPVRIEAMPDGGLNITCYRLDEDSSRMVTMLLRFTPAAAANLIGGLYRAVQSGAMSADEEEPPTH